MEEGGGHRHNTPNEHDGNRGFEGFIYAWRAGDRYDMAVIKVWMDESGLSGDGLHTYLVK